MALVTRKRSPTSSAIACLVPVLGLGLASPAVAQANPAASNPAIASPVAASPTTTSPACVSYDRFNLRGNETPITPNCDTLDPDLGGLRPFFAKYESNLQFTSVSSLSNDVLNRGRAVQSYVGENATTQHGTVAILTHNLVRYGLNEGSQLVFAPVGVFQNYRPIGRDGVYINRLSIFTPMFNNTVLVNMGYYQVANVFYGTSVGTNAGTNALGTRSSLLFQTGVQGFRPTPSIDVKVFAPDRRFYGHSGLFRSVSARGSLFDAKDNAYGLKFSVPDGGAAFINEVGFRREASADTKKIWLRAGSIYNSSPYRVLSGTGQTADNYAFYLLGDVQLTQSNPARPHLGWYANARYDVESEKVNVYSSDYSFTLYKFGTFDTRSGDLFSVGMIQNYVSKEARASLLTRGLASTDVSTTYNATYTYRIQSGLYLSGSAGYTDNPTVAPKKPGALIFSATLALLL